MSDRAEILVSGAYGLAGRAIVQRLIKRTPHNIIAAGRKEDRLRSLLRETDSAHVNLLVLDATDVPALHAACAKASFLINAIGPFARTGSAIARIALECGVPYLDCANEQRHFKNLSELDPLAKQQGIPLITAAGAIPGISTLLIGKVMTGFPSATEVDCCWAQFRHAYADSGLASMMGGILEAVDRPIVLCEGKPVPIVVGRSMKDIDLPEPFGRKSLLEIPTIDALTIPARFSLREFHTWFYMGDLPTWLLDIVRVLKPDRRPWAYRLIENIMRRINDRDTARAIASGIGPECVLQVAASSSGESKFATMTFRDGAAATACIPAHIADSYIQGKIQKTGLLTPLDLVDPESLPSIVDEAILSSEES